ncbi:MAG: protein kinase [Planctomycetota bacterium]
MPPTPDESDFRPSPSRSFIHTICDDYERDRQGDATVTMAPYISRAPGPLRDWILKELIAIEVEILQSTGKATDLDALRDSTGVSSEKFDAAWQKLQESAAQLQDGEETEHFDEGDISTVSVRRGAQVVSDSMEMSIYRTQSEPAMPAEPVQRNQFLLVADDYELIDLLGEGGMGAVYRAFQHSLQRQVALKIIPRRFVNSPQALARFYNEAEATASMKHPGIVRVFEFDERHDVHYYTMELVEGGSLGKYVRSRNRPRPPRIEPNRAADIMAKVCDAAHYAHTRPKPVIHRDIKPANILLDDSGNPLLTDFGLAKVVDSDEESLTMTGAALGTAAYMAPEQARGSKRDLSPKTDVYALGATLYALIAGRQPFEGDSPNQIMRDVIESTPTPLTKLVPTLPRELEIICEKCLAKRPEHRYETAEEVSADLRRYLQGQAISTRPLNPAQRSWRWCQRNPLAAGLMVSIMLGFVASIILGLRAVQEAERANASLSELQSLLLEAVEIIDAPEVANDPTMDPIRNAILQKAESTYETLIEDLKADPSARPQYASAQVTRGKILTSMSRTDDAKIAFEQARGSLIGLGVANSDDVESLMLLAKTHFELSRLEKLDWDKNRNLQTEKYTEPLDRWADYSQRAFELRQRVVNLEPDFIEYQRLMASAQENYAVASAARSIEQTNLNELQTAIEVQSAVQELRKEIASSPEQTVDSKLDLARGFGNVSKIRHEVANFHKRAGRLEDRVKALEEALDAANSAIEIHTGMGKSIRTEFAARKHLVECYGLQGETLRELERYEEAERSYLEGARESKSLADENPHNYYYQRELAISQLKLIEFYLQLLSDRTKAIEALSLVRITLIESLRTDADNHEAADLLYEITRYTIQLLGTPKTDTQKEEMINVLQTLIDDLEQIGKDSKYQDYDWLTSRVNNIAELLNWLSAFKIAAPAP